MRSRGFIVGCSSIPFRVRESSRQERLRPPPIIHSLDTALQRPRIGRLVFQPRGLATLVRVSYGNGRQSGRCATRLRRCESPVLHRMRVPAAPFCKLRFRRQRERFRNYQIQQRQSFAVDQLRVTGLCSKTESKNSPQMTQLPAGLIPRMPLGATLFKFCLEGFPSDRLGAVLIERP
jgi:hypothetical protein